MKIFITGATGYIGSAVAKRMQAAGHDIIGLARSDQSAQRLEANGMEVHRGDLKQLGTLRSGAARADAVVHTAMPSPQDVSDFAEIGRIAGEAQAALFEGIAGQNKIFIATSGTGAYGDTGESLVDEETPTATGGPMQGLALAEQQVLNGKEFGVRGMVIRPALVYGNGGSGPVVGLIDSIRQLGYGAYVEGVDSRLSTVHVDDLADLYLLMLKQQPVGELFNAVGEIVSTEDIVAAAMVAASVMGEMRPIAPQETMQLGFVGRYMGGNMRVSAEKAKRELGWKPSRSSILDDLRTGSYVVARAN